jgi:toxin ParE1/3/4
MPAIAIRFAEAAVADLQEIKHRYSEQGVPDVGDRLIAEIIKRIEALRDHPDIGRVVPEFDQPVLRELIHPPFRVVYRREPKLVRIVRVWRSERLLEFPNG